MLIESLRLRKGGTPVTIENRGERRIYHFKGPENGPQVAEVEDEGDIKRFLAIQSGYREFEGEAPALSAREMLDADLAMKAEVEVLQARDRRNALINRSSQIDDESDLSLIQRHQLDDINRAADSNEESLSLSDARKLYRAKMGKLPGPKWDVEKILDEMKG